MMFYFFQYKYSDVRFMCVRVCVCGHPIVYLDLSSTPERLHLRGRRLGTVSCSYSGTSLGFLSLVGFSPPFARPSNSWLGLT